MISKKTCIVLLGVVIMLLVIINLLLNPIPQSQAYHNFADQRSWLGVPNAWNVLSNIPFALAGLWGLFLLLTPGKLHFIDNRERWPWVGVSIGLILTAIGSGYYHLAPDNARLVWDRLPMTIVFMSFVAALISEKIDMRFGLWLWPLLLAIGIYSVLQWQASELRGAGDLRFYFSVQGFTIIAAVILLLTPTRYTRTWDLAVIVVFYGFAKIFEIFDHQIYDFTRGMISGHTLKHFAAALAAIWLIRMIWKRKIVKI